MDPVYSYLFKHSTPLSLGLTLGRDDATLAPVPCDAVTCHAPPSCGSPDLPPDTAGRSTGAAACHGRPATPGGRVSAVHCTASAPCYRRHVSSTLAPAASPRPAWTTCHGPRGARAEPGHGAVQSTVGLPAHGRSTRHARHRRGHIPGRAGAPQPAPNSLKLKSHLA